MASANSSAALGCPRARQYCWKWVNQSPPAVQSTTNPLPRLNQATRRHHPESVFYRGSMVGRVNLTRCPYARARARGDVELGDETDSNERLRVSNWIVQRLYHYAIKETVEF